MAVEKEYADELIEIINSLENLIKAIYAGMNAFDKKLNETAHSDVPENVLATENPSESDNVPETEKIFGMDDLQQMVKIKFLREYPFGIVEGKNLRLLAFRQQRFESQSAVARAMGINPSYLSQAEHGKHVPSRVQNIIAETYGVAPEDLFPDYQ
ncbi:MAG: helix-turn-helix domain-containing protein [Eubacterium sp.]